MKLLLFILFALKSFSQDSVELKVVWSKKVGSKVYYVFKMGNEKVKSVCECKERKRKGETVRVARKDILFIKNDL